MSRRTWMVSLSALTFYAVLVLEFLFMISPLGLHFYVGYGPALRLLDVSPATAWLTGFFLPHFSRTTSPLLNALKPVGFALALGGLAAFVASAAHLYASKLLRRGAVTGGLYRVIRHPQYVALAVLGLGTVLIWPRFLVLVSFVVMLCLYDLLARWEEARCVQRFGDAYRVYLAGTGRFLPRLRTPDTSERSSRAQPPVTPRRAAAYAAFMAVALVAAWSLRELSLARISTAYVQRHAILSPAVLAERQLERAYRLAASDHALQAALGEDGTAAPLLVYVVPAGWYLPDLPLHDIEEIRRERGGHSTGAAVGARFEVLFAYPRTHHPEAVGPRLIKGSFGLDPILIVTVDIDEGRVVGRTTPPATVVWGDIPTPLF
jgi:protein-S-isoprenylcysteine O-methyltransferase Ste14